MKRLLSLFILISFASAIGLAQSASKTERHAQVWVVNTGGASIDVKCERIEGVQAADSYNYFCWDACYSPSTDVSVGTLPIALGDMNKLFYAAYEPGTGTGNSTVKYCFYVDGSPSDSACFILTFNENSPLDSVYGLIAIGPPELIATTVSTDASTDTCDGTARVIQAGGVGTYTYLWDSNSGSQTTQMATGLCSGTYSVVVTDSAGTEIVVSATVDEPVGLTPNSKLQYPKWIMYPNPAKKRVMLNYSLKQNSELGEVIVRNILGIQVYKVDLRGTDGQVTIPVSDFRNGVYFCTMIVDNKVYATKRLVVNH
jgi:hypothetical protein